MIEIDQLVALCPMCGNAIDVVPAGRAFRRGDAGHRPGYAGARSGEEDVVTAQPHTYTEAQVEAARAEAGWRANQSPAR